MSDDNEVPDFIMGYLFDNFGNFIEAKKFDPYGGFPLNVTFTAPPEIPDGKFAVFNYSFWEIRDERAAPPPPPPPPPGQPWQVDQERDRRAGLGFVFNGKLFSTESISQQLDLIGMQGVAIAAITIGQAEVGKLDWVEEGVDFAWFAADNTPMPMDAHTCLEFTTAAMKRKMLIIGAGLRLKAMEVIPPDYWTDKYWPAMDPITSKVTRK